MPRNPRRTIRVKPVLLVAFLLLLMSFSSTDRFWSVLEQTVSAATTFTVNSTGDGADSNLADGLCNDGSGACTLRAAIQEANSVSGDDTITFSLPGSSTISLNTVLPDITGNLSINGPGLSALTVQRSSVGGTPNFRIFTITSGRTVSISGLTITNGQTDNGIPDAGFAPGYGGPGGSGGGILNSGTLTLTDVIVTGNRTGNGGAGSTASGGPGGSGGGISSSGTLTMSNVIVSNNITGNGAVGANGGQGGRGGGIYTSFSSGPLTVTSCTISGNTTGHGVDGTGASLLGGSGGSGGGFYIEGGTTTMMNVVVVNNTTGTADVNPGHSSSGGSGAGILVGSVANVTLVNSTISGNRTGDGPGPSGQGGTGGGILSAFGSLTVLSSTISGNSTGTGNGGGSAGGIYNSGPALLINTTISGNSTSGTNGQGGGVYNASNFLRVASCTISDNSAFDNSSGHGFYQFGGSSPAKIKNSIIANNGGVAGTDATGAYDSQGNNLVGKSDGTNGFIDGVNGDKVGTIASPLNAQLGTLANNGGPTQTHALLAGSPALDAGDNCVCDNTCVPAYGFSLTIDQRGTGFSRKVDGPDPDATDTVDIGAFEVQVSLADIADQTINEDSSLSLPFNVGGAASITSVTATSSNTALVPNNSANISISGSGATRTLLINPVANAFGASTITVTVNGSNSQTMSDTFLLTVNPVNDAPSFTKGLDRSVNENDGAQTVNNWATNISAGPADESGQTLTFIVANNTNPALFAVAPAISSSGTLMYSPATGVSGIATITIALMDNGGIANGGADTSATQSFNINVLEGGTLAFSAATYSVSEGGGSAAIIITRSGGSAGTATVLVTASNGTATAGDYFSVSLTITFNAGEVSKTVNVVIRDDFFKEPDKTVNLTLSNAGGSGQLGAQTTALLTIVDDDPVGGYLRFSLVDFNTTESSGSTTITLERVGDTSQAVTVDYATSDDSGSAMVVPCATLNGIASSRCDFTTALGTLRFAAGESSKTFVVLISQDNYVEGPEALTVTMSNPTGGAQLSTLTPATLTITDDATEPATNPIDNADAFVRQHYHDFLNREPDAVGLPFWSDQITSCGTDAACVELRRINVSAAFFLSIEFQQTGFLIYRMYKSAYNDLPGTPVPVRLNEFLPDTQQIGRNLVVGETGWELALENNKQAFAAEFVARTRFSTAHPTTLTPAQFVDALFTNTGVTPSATDRQAAIDEFGEAGNTTAIAARGRALRRVAENSTLAQQETNKAFVLMQYFGYLRRNPNDAPEPGLNFDGYNFWLGKLNQFGGNFVNAEMVKAFIVSSEYRQRFGP